MASEKKHIRSKINYTDGEYFPTTCGFTVKQAGSRTLCIHRENTVV